MKKFLLACGLLLGVTTVFAQEDKMLFNHVAVGAGVGTTGITIDASTTITPYVGVRAGVNFLPKIKVNTELDLDFNENIRTVYESALNEKLPETFDVQGKPNLTSGHVLFDLYPSKHSKIHLTVGAYFGSSDIVSVYNKEDGALKNIYDFNHRRGVFENIEQFGHVTSEDKLGLVLGDYFIEPDENGNADACIKVNGFRPYLGLGWGRAVPKNRIGFQFDLGVQFWGSPKIYLQDKQLEETDLDGDDGGLVKTLSKISVYPCLSFRLVGRIL